MISFISIAHASEAGVAAQGFVTKINDVILFPIIALLMAVAFIVFLYGAFVYVKNANNDAARETGRNHLIYGVIGMLVMLSAFAILKMAAATFGLSDELLDAHEGTSSLAPRNTSAPVRRPTGIADTYSTLLNGDNNNDAAIVSTPTSKIIALAALRTELEANTSPEQVNSYYNGAELLLNSNDQDGLLRLLNSLTVLDYVSESTRDALLSALNN